MTGKGPSSSPSGGSNIVKVNPLSSPRNIIIASTMAILAGIASELPNTKLGIGSAIAGDLDAKSTQLAMLSAFNVQVASLPPSIQPTFKEVSEQLSLAVREGLKVSGYLSEIRAPVKGFNDLVNVIYRFDPNDKAKKPVSFEQLSGGKSLQSVVASMRSTLKYNPNIPDIMYGLRGKDLRYKANQEFLNTDFGAFVKNVLFAGKPNELSTSFSSSTVFDRTVTNFTVSWSYLITKGVLKPDIFDRYIAEFEKEVKILESKGILNIETFQYAMNAVGGKVYIESLLVTNQLKGGNVEVTYSGTSTDPEFKGIAIRTFTNSQLPYVNDLAILGLLNGTSPSREFKVNYGGGTYIYLLPTGTIENDQKTQIAVKLGALGDGIVEGNVTLQLLQRELAESEKRLAESEKRLAESEKRLAEAEKRLAEAKEANTILNKVSNFQNMMLSGNFSKLSIIELVSFRGQIEDNLKAGKYQPRTWNVCMNALSTIIEKLESVKV